MMDPAAALDSRNLATTRGGGRGEATDAAAGPPSPHVGGGCGLPASLRPGAAGVVGPAPSESASKSPALSPGAVAGGEGGGGGSGRGGPPEARLADILSRARFSLSLSVCPVAVWPRSRVVCACLPCDPLVRVSERSPATRGPLPKSGVCAHGVGCGAATPV